MMFTVLDFDLSLPEILIPQCPLLDVTNHPLLGQAFLSWPLPSCC